VTERFVYDENGQAFALHGNPSRPGYPLKPFSQGATPENWPFRQSGVRPRLYTLFDKVQSLGLTPVSPLVAEHTVTVRDELGRATLLTIRRHTEGDSPAKFPPVAGAQEAPTPQDFLDDPGYWAGYKHQG
jgi:hypothetical protein